MKNKLKIWNILHKTFPIIFLGIIYLICSFIAWDFNILHWQLFTETIGRVMAVLMFFFYLAMVNEFYNEEF